MTYPKDDIGGLEDVPLAAIWAARTKAMQRVSTAVGTILTARKELLEAGFGDDHPLCRALDKLAAEGTRVFNDIRGTP